MMDYADSPGRGGLGGRGNLSKTAPCDFSAWFLKVMLDKITFSVRCPVSKGWRSVIAV